MTKITKFIDYLLYFAIIIVYHMNGGDFLKNRLYIIILIISVCIMSSCSGTLDSSSVTTASPSSGASTENTTTTTTGNKASGTTVTDNPSDTTDTTASSDEGSSSGSTTTTNNGNDNDPTTTREPSGTTKPATTTAPPRVVIPNVYVATSPGREVYTCSVATVDASNKSQGYITVKYYGGKSLVMVLVQKDGEKYQYAIKTKGTTVVLPLTLGSGTYTIGIYENISGTSYSLALQKSVSASVSNSLSPFLYPNQQVNFSQGSSCVYKSAQLCAGKSSDVQKVSAIFKYVTSDIRYDTAEANAIISGSVKNYCPNPDEVLSTKKGICYDYASLFAAMCRAQGIPTKLVKGYVGSNGLYHAWNQVYLKNVGWITVEYKARTGFNTLDATFYSGASNKSSVTANFTNTSYYKVYQVF